VHAGAAVDQAGGYADAVTGSTIHNFRSYLRDEVVVLLGLQRQVRGLGRRLGNGCRRRNVLEVDARRVQRAVPEQRLDGIQRDARLHLPERPPVPEPVRMDALLDAGLRREPFAQSAYVRIPQRSPRSVQNRGRRAVIPSFRRASNHRSIASAASAGSGAVRALSPLPWSTRRE
jgi:hypothetical protein